jgi:hypothetical protein
VTVCAVGSEIGHSTSLLLLQHAAAPHTEMQPVVGHAMHPHTTDTMYATLLLLLILLLVCSIGGAAADLLFTKVCARSRSAVAGPYICLLLQALHVLCRSVLGFPCYVDTCINTYDTTSAGCCWWRQSSARCVCVCVCVCALLLAVYAYQSYYSVKALNVQCFKSNFVDCV